jgi:uncharacterized protein YecT (DUF1311 family)
MKLLLWAAAGGLAICLGAAMAQDPAPTSMKGLMSVTEAYEQSDREMDDIYAKLKLAVNATGKQRLEKAQMAWTDYREAEAAFRCHHLAGGPYERMEYYAQLRKETDRRTRELRQTYEWMRQNAINNQ